MIQIQTYQDYQIQIVHLCDDVYDAPEPAEDPNLQRALRMRD